MLQSGLHIIHENYTETLLNDSLKIELKKNNKIKKQTVPECPAKALVVIKNYL